jgi:hypothetical protein
VIVTLVEQFYADNAPANFYGDQPFSVPNDFTTPNEAYFAHADWVINKAAEYGIQIVLAPNYLGCCNDGWLSALLNNNSEADARFFGNWVGQRYKDFPNLIYVWGNDLNPGTARAKIRAMAEGTKSADPNHLQTYHAAPENSALDQWDASETWLDINITYTYEPIQGKSLQDYNRVPFLPYFMFESQYERDFLNATPRQTRKQAYTAVLTGANGHHYGNNPIWHLNGRPSNPGPDWKNSLNAEGRADVQHVGELFRSRDWHLLVPDQARTLVTSGGGTGEDYVAAAVTSDSNTAIVYFPAQRAVTVNLDQVAGSSYLGWWFDPRNGTATEIDMQGKSGSQQFTPPAASDWVLVIDNAATNPRPPGSAQPVRPLPPQNLTVE